MGGSLDPAHLDTWAPSTYTAEGYQGVRQAAGYRGDLHVLVEAPDGTVASSTIMWFDEANRTAEFEPVGTHPEHRRTRRSSTAGDFAPRSPIASSAS